MNFLKAIGVVASACVISASAAPIFVGSIVDGIPVGQSDPWVQQLVNLAAAPAGTVTTVNGTFVHNSEIEILRRSDKAAPAMTLTAGAEAGPEGINHVVGTGSSYIALHYGGQTQSTAVFYLNGGTINPSDKVSDLATDFGVNLANFGFVSPQGGFSGYHLFTGTAVPDGGATVMLMGLGLVGLGLARRKIS